MHGVRGLAMVAGDMLLGRRRRVHLALGAVLLIVLLLLGHCGGHCDWDWGHGHHHDVLAARPMAGRLGERSRGRGIIAFTASKMR